MCRRCLLCVRQHVCYRYGEIPHSTAVLERQLCYTMTLRQLWENLYPPSFSVKGRYVNQRRECSKRDAGSRIARYYYGITDNTQSLSDFGYRMMKSLFKWLNRRSQKKSYNWEGHTPYNFIEKNSLLWYNKRRKQNHRSGTVTRKGDGT